MEFDELYNRARAVVNPRHYEEFIDAAAVGAAILTDAGNVYVGANIDAACGVGFCAEHSAIAAMITAGEHIIRKVIAVGSDGGVMPPCGRCREFMSQLARENLDAEVMVARDKIVSLRELLPFDWK